MSCARTLASRRLTVKRPNKETQHAALKKAARALGCDESAVKMQLIHDRIYVFGGLVRYLLLSPR
jgi:hypothetical protein